MQRIGPVTRDLPRSARFGWASSLPRHARLVGLALLALMMLALGFALPAEATVPIPAANQAIVSVKVGGDRLADGSVAGLNGITLQLYAAGTATTPGTIYNPAWSWTHCTPTSDGDCNFIIPIRTGAPDATGVPQDTRFWVQQTATTTGWYANPTVRTGSFDESTEFSTPYRFRTDIQLRAGTTYRSTDPMPAALNLLPDRGFMRNREDTNTEGSMAENVTRTTGRWSQSRTNPPPVTKCAQTVGLVVDTSGSLGFAGMAQVKAALDAFVDAYLGTPARLGLISFSTTSPGGGASNHPVPVPVGTVAQGAAFKAQYAGWTSGGGTNWDVGLAAAANAVDHYDQVIMLTDGNPTVSRPTPNAGGSAFNSLRDLDDGIFSANQLKAQNTRITAIGVGTAVTSPASAANLRAISGVVEDSDYYRVADFNVAANVLKDLAVRNCQGSIKVQKMIVPPGGTTLNAVPAGNDWQFAASSLTTGLSVAAPANQTTDANGSATFGLAYTGTTTTGSVQVLETQKPGYSVVPVAGKNAVCTNTKTGLPVTVTNQGSTATPGFSVGAPASEQISCTIYNQAPPPVWTLAKTSVPPSGSVVNPGDTITYTLTATNSSPTAATNVVVTDNLSAVLNNATFGSITNNDGGTATRTGNTLTWNVGTLGAGTTRTVTYTVTVNAGANGVVLRNSVSGVGDHPPTACTVVSPCVTTHTTPVTLTYSKTSNPPPGTAVKPGDTVTYTVKVVNPTSGASTSGLVTDNMAAVLDKATLTAPPTLACTPTASSCGQLAYTSGSNSFVWSSTAANPLAGNTTATITYTVQINTGATGTLHNVLVEPNVVVDHPIITWNKVVDKGADTLVNPRDTLTYTLTVNNTGTVASLPFSVFDDLTNVVNQAAFVTGSITVSPTGRGTATYDATTKKLTWTGALPAGQSVTITYQVTVKADAFGQLKNAFIDKTVVNPISASVRWRKVGPDGQPLAGSQWTLTPVDSAGQPTGPAVTVNDCTQTPCTGRDTDPLPGRFLVVGLTSGNYRLVETKAPIGYVRKTTPIAVVVGATSQISVLADVVNDQQHSPALPFAGGIGSDHLKIAGAALLALTIVLAAWQRKRQRPA